MAIDSDNIEYNIEQVGNCMTCCCAGEGCFLTTLQAKDGTDGGYIYLSTYDMEKLASQFVTVRTEQKQQSGGEGAPSEARDMTR